MDIPAVPGFGFHPNEDVSIGYLRQRVLEHFQGLRNSNARFMPDIDIYQEGPGNLPGLIINSSPMQHNNQDEWYFFCPRRDKYHSGNRSDRTVQGVGYWKATGKKRDVISNGMVIGTKWILVFHEGRSSSGKKTGWVIHEYHLSPSYLGDSFKNLKEMPFVACCLKKADDGSTQDEDVFGHLPSLQ